MLWPLKRIKIHGHSMQPSINDGDFLLVNCWAYLFRSPQIGDVVVFRNPQNKKQLICKRIADTRGHNYIVKGDNHKDSFDSEKFGSVAGSSIIGKMI